MQRIFFSPLGEPPEIQLNFRNKIFILNYSIELDMDKPMNLVYELGMTQGYQKVY